MTPHTAKSPALPHKPSNRHPLLYKPSSWAKRRVSVFFQPATTTRVPHLRDGFIVAKVGKQTAKPASRCTCLYLLRFPFRATRGTCFLPFVQLLFLPTITLSSRPERSAAERPAVSFALAFLSVILAGDLLSSSSPHLPGWPIHRASLRAMSGEHQPHPSSRCPSCCHSRRESAFVLALAFALLRPCTIRYPKASALGLIAPPKTGL